MLIDGKQIRDASITAAKLAAAVLNGFLKADCSVAWTGAQNANSQRLTNLGAPVSPNDGARLQDIISMPWKEKCVAATTANVNLATVGLSAQDGVTISNGDRVLVWKQTTASENGIYIASSGAWMRSADADSAAELRAAVVRIEQGTLYGDHQFALTTDNITLGTTGLTFVDLGVGNTAGYLTPSNKGMAASTTSADFQVACATTLAFTPAGDGHVRVLINGCAQTVGDGVRTKDCYFSSDGGATAKTIANITSGDSLYWVGSVAGFQLAAATDVVDFDYLA